MVGRHVLERGAKSVAFVRRSEMCLNVEHRLNGLLSALARKHGARLTGQYVLLRDGAVMAKRWRARIPDAIVCASDFIAAHVLRLLRKIKKRSPQDVLLTGVDDIDLATLVSPQLTTVHQPCEEIARTAFETLLWRMDNPDAATRRILVATKLVIRESTTR